MILETLRGAEVEDFADPDPIAFGDGVNLLRGDNGVGKTQILEALSLVGHLPILRQDTLSLGQPVDADVTLLVSEREVNWLEQLVAENSTMLSAARTALMDAPISHRHFAEDKIEAIRGWLAAVRSGRGDDHAKPAPFSGEGEAVADPLRPYRVRLQFIKDTEAASLKEALTSDARLRADWRVVLDPAENGLAAVAALLAWNRPELMGLRELEAAGRLREHRAGEADEWCRTPRTHCRMTKFSTPTAPGVVSYINTDMYDWGTGLDIRESPKDFSDSLTRVLIARLQALNFDSQARRGPVGLPEAGPRLLINYVQEGGAPNAIKPQWDYLFPSVAKRLRDDALHNDEIRDRKLHLVYGSTGWEVKIGTQDRTFLSSGENQALFLLTMLFSVAPPGSCLLIDEPELHFSVSVAARMIDLIRVWCRSTNSQAIIVTHAPFLFTQEIREEPRPTVALTALTTVAHGWGEGAERDRMTVIYLPAGDGKEVLYSGLAMDALAKLYNRYLSLVVRHIRIAPKAVYLHEKWFWPIWAPPVAIVSLLVAVSALLAFATAQAPKTAIDRKPPAKCAPCAEGARGGLKPQV
ncbi:AAA family ATPase [Caulobacter sp. SLTY]|uniref:AAA family ATPase n=1 Tax=Caulobacter sp. SLTY TaxID=2683262 RepID=UPI0014128E5D|nr:AAA family ATPase [Caulobacter sp. SLTY]NBB16422.1 AAA family ATPase [Caulobacter sp. SLTY]